MEEVVSLSVQKSRVEQAPSTETDQKLPAGPWRTQFVVDVFNLLKKPYSNLEVAGKNSIKFPIGSQLPGNIDRASFH